MPNFFWVANISMEWGRFILLEEKPLQDNKTFETLHSKKPFAMKDGTITPCSNLHICVNETNTKNWLSLNDLSKHD